MNLRNVREVRRTGSLEVVNELLATGSWKLAHEVFSEFGDLEFVLYRTK